MPEDVRVTARRVFAIAVLVLAVVSTTSVFLTLVRLDRDAAGDRPEATHWFDREPELRSWTRLASGLATNFYVQAQYSLLIGPAAAFTIGGAWLLVASTRRN